MDTIVTFKVEHHECILRQDIKTIALYNSHSEHIARRCIVIFVESGNPLPPPHSSLDDQGNITDGTLFFRSEFIPLFLDMLRNERIWVGLSQDPKDNGIYTQNWQSHYQQWA
jgi:hypothetical protein